MLDDFDRYAVYWVPCRPDPLGPFGDDWTGWCAEYGEHRPRSDFPDLPALTRKLCRHGLHGVIHAPFRLAPGRSRFAVEDVLDEIAEETVAIQLPRLELAVVQGRVALVPSRCPDALAALVDRVTEMLGPLTGAEEPDGFTESAGPFDQSGSVVPFGAPAHRFHVPLTDARPLDEAHALKDALVPVVASLLDAPRTLSVITLMGDPGGGRPLRTLENYTLLETPLRPGAGALPSHGPQVLAPTPAVRRKSDAAI